MKTLSRFKGMLFLAIVTATACTDQKQTPSEILGNQENREAIMAEISNDQGMMTEMMAQMTQNKHAMQMMEGNKDMMGKNYGQPSAQNAKRYRYGGTDDDHYANDDGKRFDNVQNDVCENGR